MDATSRPSGLRVLPTAGDVMGGLPFGGARNSYHWLLSLTTASSRGETPQRGLSPLAAGTATPARSIYGLLLRDRSASGQFKSTEIDGSVSDLVVTNRPSAVTS